MKMIHRRALLAAGLLASVLTGAVAYAGYAATAIVTVTPGVSGSGSLYDARVSGESSSYIGCTVLHQPGTGPYATCTASDAQGNWAVCRTWDREKLATIRSLNEGAFLSFRVGYAQECEDLMVSVGSYYMY